jgi:hypothetical protein
VQYKNKIIELENNNSNNNDNVEKLNSYINKLEIIIKNDKNDFNQIKFIYKKFDEGINNKILKLEKDLKIVMINNKNIIDLNDKYKQFFVKLENKNINYKKENTILQNKKKKNIT